MWSRSEVNKPIERIYSTFYVLVSAVFTLTVAVREIITYLITYYSIRTFDLEDEGQNDVDD